MLSGFRIEQRNSQANVPNPGFVTVITEKGIDFASKYAQEKLIRFVIIIEIWYLKIVQWINFSVKNQ